MILWLIIGAYVACVVAILRWGLWPCVRFHFWYYVAKQMARLYILSQFLFEFTYQRYKAASE